jgi:hypothetical protein
MIFNIGPWRYVVRRRWGLTCDGGRCDGLCACSTRTIWLDGQLREDIMEGVLRHEHVHAWENEVGTPRTSEDRACFVATVSAAFQKEYTEQGGFESLLQIPIEGLDPSAATPVVKLWIGGDRYAVMLGDPDGLPLAWMEPDTNRLILSSAIPPPARLGIVFDHLSKVIAPAHRNELIGAILRLASSAALEVLAPAEESKRPTMRIAT